MLSLDEEARWLAPTERWTTAAGCVSRRFADATVAAIERALREWPAMLHWYRDVLCDGERLAAEMRATDPLQIICEAASTSPAGAEGLSFTIDGFTGLTPRHTKADVSRAVLEGCAHAIAASVPTTLAIDDVRLTGAMANNAFWRQLLADTLDAPVTAVASASAAHGAALIAACGLAGCALSETCTSFVGGLRAANHPDAIMRDKLAAARESS